MDTSKFPPNNDKHKKGSSRKVERVTTGEVSRKKKSLRKQFSETFVEGDMKTTARFVVMGVLLPAARDMIYDAASEGVHKLIFGDKGRRRGGSTTPYSGPTGHIAYNRYSRSPEDDRPPFATRGMSQRGRAKHDFDEIVLDQRAEAEEVIDRLYDVVSRYEQATVADLYDLVGLSSTHTDHKWGWTDLRGAGVSRIRDGYLLDLPDPEPLD
jgi:hypothetical protein